MASFNKVILMGNLTRDPELKDTQGNVAVCSFGLAVNRKWRDQSGQPREETTFVDLTAFGRQAETINQYMAKGRPLLIEGRLKFDQWTGQDGARRSKLSVIVERAQFLGSGQQRDGEQGGQTNRDEAPPDHGTPPADRPQTDRQPSDQRGGEYRDGGYRDAPQPVSEPAPAAAPTGDDIPF